MIGIGLCSAGGTGKTTLLEPLSKKFDLPIVNLTTGELMKQFNLDNQNEVVAVAGVVPHIGIDFQSKLIKDRTNHFRRYRGYYPSDGFISDRTPLDSLAYYMIHNCYWDKEENTVDLIREVTDSANLFEYVFMLPVGVIPVENNGIRGLNPFYHGMIQENLKFLANMTGYKLIEVPDDVLAIEDRVNWIYITKDMLKKLLRKTIVGIRFLKKDGTERLMKATLDPNYLEKFEFSESGSKNYGSKTGVENIAVIDTEKNEWRSFNISSVIDICIDTTSYKLTPYNVQLLLNRSED